MKSTRKLTNMALLTAVSLIIFTVELKIPPLTAVPGAKLGLANIITVYAVYHYSGKEVLLMVMARIFLGSIFGGNMITLFYSLTGALFCLGGMIYLHRFIDEKYIWLCSVFGAVLHNTGQIITAILIMQTAGIAVYFPFLLVSGCIAGACTGLCAQYLIGTLKKISVPFGEKI